MAYPTSYTKVTGKTTGGTLTNGLANLKNISIANAFRNIGSWFQSVGIGSRCFNGAVFAGGTPATNAVTFSSFVAGDTVTVNGVVFTGSDTASTNVEILTGGTDATVAASFVSLINSASAPAKVLGVLQASAASNVVTLNAIDPGAIGNLYTLAISAHGSVTGATFASGADGTITLLSKGL